MVQSNLRHQHYRSAYPGVYTPAFEFPENSTSLAGSETVDLPAVDLFEEKNYLNIEMAVPGLKRENLFVKINEKGNLVIKGIQRIKQSRSGSEHVSTRTFRREIALPHNVDTDFVKAEFRTGVLSICFLKTTENYRKRPSVVAVY